MNLDLRAVAENMRKADTEDLLDRVTVYRDGMEPAAVDLIEGELARRGVTEKEIAEHERLRREAVVFRDDGTAVKCSFCHRLAVLQRRGWHKIGQSTPGVFPLGILIAPVMLVGHFLLGWLPLFRRTFAYCDVHAAEAGLTGPPGALG